MRTPLIRLIAFLVLSAAALSLTGPIVGFAGISGTRAIGWYGAVLSVLLVAATYACARFNKESLSNLGFSLTRKRAAELGVGFLCGALLFAGVEFLRGASVGGEWVLNQVPSASHVASRLFLVLSLMLAEELLFRGYAFQQLVHIMGTRRTLIVSALLFGAYHMIGSHDWAMGAVYHFLMPTLGGLVFGYALLRTGSLALPIGLHWGGNWVQSSVLGLGHLRGQSSSVWVMPLNPEQVQQVTAPDVLPHLPYIMAMAVTCALVHVLCGRKLVSEAVAI